VAAFSVFPSRKSLAALSDLPALWFEVLSVCVLRPDLVCCLHPLGQKGDLGGFARELASINLLA